MNLVERRASVAGKAKCRAKCAPVIGREDVGVLNQRDRLALPGNTRTEEGIQIVNLGQVRGHERISGAAQRIRECELRQSLVHLVHGVGSKIMQRDNTGDHGS